MRNIIIYKKNKNLNNNFFPTFIHYNLDKIYDLYDARFINPPFFDNIYIYRDDLNIEELQMIYNMVYTNGTITFPDKYKYFFKKNVKNLEHNYLVKKKTDNYVYQFKKNRFIDFIIMGTQKGGTTALAHNIGKHPNIYLDKNEDPAISEVHFFDIRWYRGREWYKKQFNYSKKMVGDKTPELMYLDYTFPLIQSLNPYVKIIIILRNPIERAYSSWKHTSKYYNEKRTFEDAINEEIENKLNENKTFFTAITHYLQRGLYYQQIQNILKWFSRDNLLILFDNEVKKDMIGEYNKVYKFLNLAEYIGNYELKYISENKHSVDKETYNKLINFFKKDVTLLEKFLNKKTGWLKKI
jgi:hypothetical protein